MGVVFSSHVFADSIFHKSTETWQAIDRWIDTSAVHFSIEHNLPLSDISSEIGNRMTDIVIRHSENGKLRDRTTSTGDLPRSLIELGQIRIEIPWVPFAARDLSP